MKMKLSFLYLAIVFAFSSCIKDELTLPAGVSFKFDMLSHQSEDEEEDEDENGGLKSFTLFPSGLFSIDKGTLVVDAIEFDGRREEGQDVYFSSDFPGPVFARLEEQSTNFDIRFDIPQGIYNRIDITIHLDTSQQPSLILEGSLKIGIFEPVLIRFEYNFPDQVPVRAVSARPGQNIVLRKDQPSTATVLIDAGFLFRFVNMGILANADRIDVNGAKIILINNQYNTLIFNQLGSRIQGSIAVVFE